MDSKMINLDNTTFIIPVRIESNDRYRNLFLSVGYLLKNTTGKIIIMESDKVQYVPKILDLIKNSASDIDIENRVHYIHEYSEDSIFHRTRLLNQMLIQSNTEIVVNYDCDVLLPLSSYKKASDMILHEDYDLVYPFRFGDGAQLRVVLTDQSLVEFEETSDLSVLKGFEWRSEHGFCQFFKKQSYFNGYCENEDDMIGWTCDDQERFYRFDKLGYKIGRVDDRVYHLEHMRTNTSTSQNEFFMRGENAFEKIKKMTKEELINYYENLEYYKNTKKKDF